MVSICGECQSYDDVFSFLEDCGGGRMPWREGGIVFCPNAWMSFCARETVDGFNYKTSAATVGAQYSLISSFIRASNCLGGENHRVTPRLPLCAQK